VATNTAEDVIEGRKSFKDSLIDNTLDEVKNVVGHQPNVTINRKRSNGKNNAKRTAAAKRTKDIFTK
jgi:hypothetical protein